MADVYLKDSDGNDVLYEGIDTVILQGSDGEEVSFTEGSSTGSGSSDTELTTTDLSIELYFSSGENMEFTPDDGTAYSSVTVLKPDTLISENIANGVNIAGIDGSFTNEEEIQDTVDYYYLFNLYLYGLIGFLTVSPDIKILRFYGYYEGDLTTASTCVQELTLMQDTSLLYSVALSDEYQPVYVFEVLAQIYYAYASIFNAIFTQGDTVKIGGVECTAVPEITTQETWSDLIAMLIATIPEDLESQGTQFSGTLGSLLNISGITHWRLPFIWEIYSDGTKIDEFVLEFNLTVPDNSDAEE